MKTFLRLLLKNDKLTIYGLIFFFLIYSCKEIKKIHLQNSPRPEDLYIPLHTLCDSSPWGSSQNSGHYTVERTPS